ncbi:MAG: Holliday junction branch migration protein RuvA [Acidobacteriota bacterium]|jgi:Holliday junction DNA helicase RuvA|nr:Holliday junction branch migration protein RuvA [Acidobacteriota bacterium]
MIGQLRGKLINKKPNLLLVDVQGVGYEATIPLTTFYELPEEGGEVVLKIHTHVREDAIVLFGFHSQREKDFFLKLVTVSGVGPKLAVAILSGAPVEELAQALAAGDTHRLTSIPGVGKKTAERLALELKGQMSAFLLPEQAEAAKASGAALSVEDDILSALVNLGYPRPSAEKAISLALRDEGVERTFEGILKTALRRLAG